VIADRLKSGWGGRKKPVPCTSSQIRRSSATGEKRLGDQKAKRPGSERRYLVTLEWAGGELRLVNPAYTSQECSVCHHVARENRKNRDKFQCVACGHAGDADVNAAKNIKVAGLAASACGGLGASRPPVKQAPPREKERCHAA